MLIRVICKDKSSGCVEDASLETLIAWGEIVAFFRPGSDEWVDIASGRFRKKADSTYTGPERRHSKKAGATT
jgi:hypothetical protein